VVVLDSSEFRAYAEQQRTPMIAKDPSGYGNTMDAGNATSDENFAGITGLEFGTIW